MKKRIFAPIRVARRYEGVVEQIREMILKGKFKPGDKLPSERQLCEEFEVGRPSVREALRALEITGLIEIRHGEGAFVKDIDFTHVVLSMKEILKHTGNLPIRYGTRPDLY